MHPSQLVVANTNSELALREALLWNYDQSLASLKWSFFVLPLPEFKMPYCVNYNLHQIVSRRDSSLNVEKKKHCKLGCIMIMTWGFYDCQKSGNSDSLAVSFKDAV
uniref:Ovule protein n=1 Tax=Ascaris lumbricoides TaxID=6252 RepID=A0A0M3HWE0_ASCLU